MRWRLSVELNGNNFERMRRPVFEFWTDIFCTDSSCEIFLSIYSKKLKMISSPLLYWFLHEKVTDIPGIYQTTYSNSLAVPIPMCQRYLVYARSPQIPAVCQAMTRAVEKYQAYARCWNLWPDWYTPGVCKGPSGLSWLLRGDQTWHMLGIRSRYIFYWFLL